MYTSGSFFMWFTFVRAKQVAIRQLRPGTANSMWNYNFKNGRISGKNCWKMINFHQFSGIFEGF